MIRTIILPSCVDGIVTGCILAIGRIVGESAALLFTAGMGLKLLGGFLPRWAVRARPQRRAVHLRDGAGQV